MPVPYRILMPCSNRRAQYANVSLRLLKKYWSEHPPIDVIHHEDAPNPVEHVYQRDMGPQVGQTWCGYVLRFLTQHDHPHAPYYLLTLEDYALCAKPKQSDIEDILDIMEADPQVACCHLTYNPAPLWHDTHLLDVIQPWDYLINTQATLWRKSVLVEILSALGPRSIEQFETEGTHYWKRNHRGRLICQATMIPPPAILSFADSMDKTHWLYPYNNLARRGRLDPRHINFLVDEGFTPEEIQRLGPRV